MKFRKRPVVIDAVQFADSGKSLAAISDLTDTNIVVSYADREHPTLKIETLEGTMTARLGDWIIRGVKGEMYPCRGDIFEETYEPAE